MRGHQDNHKNFEVHDVDGNVSTRAGKPPASVGTCLVQLIENFLNLWKTAGLIFGINQLPVFFDIENAFTAFD